MTEKFCKDCKYSEGEIGFMVCHAPQNKKILNLETGEYGYYVKFCSTLRMHTITISKLAGMCGKKGRWFKEK